MKINKSWKDKFNDWQNDWCLFAKEVLRANLDEEQTEKQGTNTARD